MKGATVNCERRCPLRSPWILGLVILCVASVALSDEQTLEGSRQHATVLDAGGQFVAGGRLVGNTVLGEPLTHPLQLSGGNYIIRPGYLSKGKISPPTTSTEEPAGAPALASRLEGNRPNPFNPSTNVHFEVARSGRATLKVYDVRGRLVRTLAEREFESGRHRVGWDGRNDGGQPMASGVYLLEMVAGDYRGQHKMILAR